MNYQNYQNLMVLTSSDTDASILVYKFRPKRTGFNVYAEYTRPQLTFLALHPWIEQYKIAVFKCFFLRITRKKLRTCSEVQNFLIRQ